ncbi:MAG: hypothetical protein GX131_04725 [candidate division WS1 bacterium]|jgi:hypothetical protein|nr:hypothetical protein [candidate division WS1 bacterium]
MKIPGSYIAAVAVGLIASSGLTAADDLVLSGWGLDAKNMETFLEQAADVGFDALITGSTDPEFLAQAVEAAAKHNISILAYISPMGHIQRAWREAYPDVPIPWQVMNDDEEAAFNFISAGDNSYIIPYQWGGEAIMTNEVLTNRAICFSSDAARDLFKPMIDNIASVPGVDALGFDGFGYQNYRRCYCEECQKRLADYMAAHPDMPEEEASVNYFRDALVGYINHLAGYARSKRANIKTSIHIWPVFMPEPLYGNRLDIDYCGQTAAWYTLWPEEKIAEYSRIIVQDANNYYPRQQGVGMIGYYDRPGEFPVKDAERVDMELRTMIENGCRRIQVCSSIHVVNSPEIAEVFRRYFK